MTKEIKKREVTEREKRIILRGVKRKTVRELADETGLSMEQVLETRQELLDSVDVLTIDQQIAVMLTDLDRLVQKAEDEFDTTNDSRSKGPLITAAMGGVKLALAEVRKLKADNEGSANGLNQMRQKEIVAVYGETGQGFLEWLKAHPKADADERQATYDEMLMASARRMDERNSE